jgi:multidrug efflux pump subunit AcrA (membrane-fusion protein)
VAGTIGYGPVSTLAAAGGSSAGAVAQAQGGVSSANQRLAADRQAAADQTAVDQQMVAQAQGALAADQQRLQQDQQKQQQDCGGAPASPACSTDQQSVAADGVRVQADQAALATARAQARQRQDQAGAAVAADQVAADNAARTLQPVLTASVRGTVFTGFPAVGATVSQGQALYAVDGHAVPLLYGSAAMFRMMSAGCSGPDVQQLEEDLLQLGFADASNLAADGSFTAADAAAVRRWQASLGVPQTGDVALGDAVFLPGPVRVAAVRAAVGAPVQGGQPVLDLTAGTRLVTVNLNPSLAFSVKPGDPVMVDLPDGHTRTPGVVAKVSTVAQQAAAQGAQSPNQSPNGAPQSFVPVTISLSDPSQVPPLDQAPVTVDVTTQSARNVLAVPVNALLALEGGGYAVEVPGAGGRGTRLLPVKTGIFDNSMVEVSGPGLAAGMAVVVPR